MTIEKWGSVNPEIIWSEPEDGGHTIRKAIASAKYSVDITMYEMGGPDIISALVQAKKNGVPIRIMFNGQFFAGDDLNNQRYDNVYNVILSLTQAPGSGSLTFHWASNNFSITHQKTIIIDAFKDGKCLPAAELPDSAKALVLSLNTCQYAWMRSSQGQMFPMPWAFWGETYPELNLPIRDFGAQIAEPEQIAKIASVFASDFSCAGPFQVNPLKNSTDGLVWSNGTTGLPQAKPGEYPPDGIYHAFSAENLGADSVDQGNARPVHLDLIAAAQHSLIVYNEEMNDDEIVAALVQAASRGVKIRVLLTGNTKMSGGQEYYQFSEHYDQLSAANVEIRLFPANPDFMYIHAKVLLADANTDQAIAFMGSENISGNSLNFNRELGIIVKGEAHTGLFIDTFEKDWGTAGLIAWQAGAELVPSPYTNWLPEYNPGPFDTTPMTAGPVVPRST
ncbi:phosphatidylserine/phosphatidylglycerophosphate/ cardiolipin synthase-like protein [Oleiphilus messinensis]|uniref:phospholipase D n=1 Tax=Oleiphilus messinensis TaxID=141451 RepID=A0A1Y0IB39_9GAMM|nr:phospholipase D-like domain-containing protein [Oleiphilus messinensis]ARU56634.1 phosphatidylserine/phosphatidylglycerophosphate/ cardiolipin synthase-like protein [Oleiphilus messinensis]